MQIFWTGSECVIGKVAVKMEEYERRMAIITESACWAGSGNEDGKTVLNLVMICISGAQRGQELDKRYVFASDPPEYLRRDLLKMGFRVESTERLKDIAGQFVGIIIRVSLAQDGDTFRVYIDDYFGRDNPQKYKNG